ncbi:MAG TPA: molybdopterin-dependent oxidoreductase, partial [Thermomicrobiaceae bacterium]|nr:molybdopterin-dependent oxidoreductase [Thermomicrobiaceae bacterium]
GMEVLTHSPAVVEGRQFVLQMYLVDHALDCPTCDKSGECYLQDNTYLHNIHMNPFKRPKLARSYTHLSDLIDYKWDRCIICARCTRVCDEVVGVTAIEVLGRGLEAEIGPAYGTDLRDTTCTNCGMCIAVCPVGALTDRRFGNHPWELDATETICGFCDVGCTLNVEHNRGIIRRVSHLWDRGVNHGYTCERGKWGYDQVQHPDRLTSAYLIRDGELQPVSLDEALDAAATELRHYQGSAFAALASPDNTNEESYLLQQFTRAVMGSNNIDRLMTPEQAAVSGAMRQSFGRESSTNSMLEMFDRTGSALVVGPNIGDTAPVASYWLYWSRLYRETKTVVISRDHLPLCDRAEVWLRPAEGTEVELINAIARVIIDQEWARPTSQADTGYDGWVEALSKVDVAQVAARAGVAEADLRRAAACYATGGISEREGVTADQYPGSVIYQTLGAAPSDSPDALTIALNNLALLTGNVGRPGGGVLAFRGRANLQGATDMGCLPDLYPGYQPAQDADIRRTFESVWLSRWGETIPADGDFKPLKALPSAAGADLASIVDGINNGTIKAMYISASSHKWGAPLDSTLLEALSKLELLIVEETMPGPLTELAHIVLPGAMFMEKDGTYTNADRTIQRLRRVIPPPGESRASWELIQELSQRLGYNLQFPHPSFILEEIARMTPIYRGASFPRLERGPLQWPIQPFSARPTAYLEIGNGLIPGEIQFVSD